MKKHNFTTIEQILNVVTKDNVELLATDFRMWLKYYLEVIDGVKETYPKETEGLQNTQIAHSTFQWIDDGEVGIKGVDLVSPANGEVLSIRFDEQEQEDSVK
jgi:hypothetical protein